MPNLRRDRSLATLLEVVVSSEDDAEVRRVSIRIWDACARCSGHFICGIALPQPADVAHQPFNLFVETEFDPNVGAILAARRKRSEDETSIWAAHVLFVDGEAIGDLQYETDRSRFLGRGQDIRNAVSITDGRPLSNTVGPVLDPVMSLRRTVHIPPGTTARIAFTTIVAPTRQQALDLADKYRDARVFERTLTLAGRKHKCSFIIWVSG
jgi:cyclic beta-1,2-glucan synthetase